MVTFIQRNCLPCSTNRTLLRRTSQLPKALPLTSREDITTTVSSSIGRLTVPQRKRAPLSTWWVVMRRPRPQSCSCSLLEVRNNHSTIIYIRHTIDTTWAVTIISIWAIHKIRRIRLFTHRIGIWAPQNHTITYWVTLAAESKSRTSKSALSSERYLLDLCASNQAYMRCTVSQSDYRFNKVHHRLLLTVSNTETKMWWSRSCHLIRLTRKDET